ncbi:hypothetical protein CRYUN_Cryun33cG0026600 [Craigia yunnanensis]
MAESSSLEYKPSWVVAAVCFFIILISVMAERGLNHLGKCLRRHKQDAIFEALQKLKAELMLLGFISLLLNVFQGLISQICIPTHLESSMLPCKKHTESKSHEKYSPQAINNGRRLFSAHSSSGHCSHQIRQWKPWEDWISKVEKGNIKSSFQRLSFNLSFVIKAFWSLSVIWFRVEIHLVLKMSFFKQLYSSVTQSEYIALREGFIMTHCPANREFDFHKYMMLSLERDFRHVVGISWYQWLFVVVFLTLNVEGWHTYFWLSFLPLVLLLLVGAKLEHIIVRLAQDVDEMKKPPGQEAAPVKPSDEYFWFTRPRIVLHFIHFILFQNAFEIAFFFWILWTYGFHSCVMERKGYIIPRLIMGVIVQGLCSYITLPLYALVTKMGTSFESVQVQVQSPVININIE